MRWITEIPGRLPILARLLIANGLVVVIGAGVGTTLTKILVDQSAFALAVMFTVAGCILSITINYFILRIALQPLTTLTSTVNRVRGGDTSIRAPEAPSQDPDIAVLTQALNTMLDRLEFHTATIEANRQQLRALSIQITNAQEDERKRIARELHDETSQSLASLLIALERIDSAIPLELPDLKQRIASAHNLSAETLDGLRALIADLRPSLLDDLGLIPAIRWYARQRLEPEGIDLEVNAPTVMPRLPTTVETALFRIAQEAIHNIVKHADAGLVRITVVHHEGLTMTIEDDGIGFQADQLAGAARNGHVGLFGVRERVAALGGMTEVRSRPDEGTCVQITIPYEMCCGREHEREGDPRPAG